MSQDTSLGIGDLAQLTGVPVRTVRFYCDEGLLEPRRSVGGHRRFDPAQADRLTLIRRLRGLGLGLPAIGAVLAGDRSVAEAAAAQRAALDTELAALAWRRASLLALEQADPAGRAPRLELLAAVAADGRAGHDALVAFWRHWFVAPPDELFDMFVAVIAPEPPSDPSPVQVVAYAEMVAVATDRTLTPRLHARARAYRTSISDETALQAGIGEACGLARPLLLAGRRPGPGSALDQFVAAHAAVRGARDSPGFRRRLLTEAAVERDPRLRRYLELIGVVTGEPAPLGAAYGWLLDALETAVSAADGHA